MPAFTPSRRAAGFVLFFAIVALFIATYSFRNITDTDLNSLQTRALALHGDVDLSRYQLDPRALWVSWHGDRYSIYGVGVSLPAVPMYAVLARTDVSDRTLQASTSIPFAAAAVVVLFVVALKLFTKPVAVASAVAFAFGTTIWPTAAMAFFQSAETALFQAIGLAGLFSRRSNAPTIAGFGFAAATFVRPIAGIPLLLVGAFYLLHGGWRGASRYMLGAAVPLFGIVAQNRWIWGGWLTGGYSHAGIGFHGHTPQALWGLVFGWWRGLLVYSPVLMLGFVGAVAAARKARGFVESRMVLLAAISVATILLYSKFTTWYGGLNQFGYRYLLDAVPFLILLGAYAIQRSERIRPVAALLLGLSVLTMTFGAGPNDFGFDYRLFAPNFVDASIGQAWLAGVQHPLGSVARLAGVGAVGWLFWRMSGALAPEGDPT